MLPGRILQLPPRRIDPRETELRRYMIKRLESLRQERQSWLDHWRDCSDHMLPRRGRFLLEDRNKGNKKNEKIYNSAARRALRVGAAGMMAGITSPARPWFRFSTQDPELAKFAPVREYLHTCEEIVRDAFAKSNIYQAIHNSYLDLFFGTAVMHVEDDPRQVLRGYVFPLGQYFLAQSARLQIDTIYREFSMTVEQLVKRFTPARCSARVRDLYDKGSYDQWIPVIHCIVPNDERQFGRADFRGMPFRSLWAEKEGEEASGGLLHEGGFEEFPAPAPRWEVAGEDVYGSGPAMDALPDTKGLQQLERRKLQLVDKLTNPPMKGPPSLRRGSLLPGDLTSVEPGASGQTYEPAMVVEPTAINVVNESTRDHIQRINAEFYADLWESMLAEDKTMTAREVAERHEEKMLQLGPVLNRLEAEFLNVLIDRAFGILDRRGFLPPPPEEIAGQEFRVEYISVMAEAQKLLQVTGMSRLIDTVIAIQPVHPDVTDKVNWDALIDKFGDAVGVPPDLINSEDKVKALREAKAQAAQAEQQGQAMVAAAGAAKDLGSTPVTDNNALGALMNRVGPIASAAAGVPSA